MRALRLMVLALLLIGFGLASSQTSRADTVVALLGGTQLTTFDTATPGAVGATVTISGLRVDEQIVGIDFRPATPGVLVGLGRLGTSGFVYTINTATGAATAINSSGFALTGTRYSIDFNPVPNALRIIGADGSNLRITAGGAGVFNTDTALSQLGIVGAAYSSNFAGATSTTLYEFDSVNGTLVRQGGLNAAPSPNLGQITTIGSLGLGFSFTSAGFDITSGGTAFATFTSAAGGNGGLYTIDLATGLATQVGGLGAAGVTDIAVLPATNAVPEPASGVLLAMGIGALMLRRRKMLASQAAA
jgi:hypothetical protein